MATFSSDQYDATSYMLRTMTTHNPLPSPSPLTPYDVYKLKQIAEDLVLTSKWNREHEHILNIIADLHDNSEGLDFALQSLTASLSGSWFGVENTSRYWRRLLDLRIGPLSVNTLAGIAANLSNTTHVFAVVDDDNNVISACCVTDPDLDSYEYNSQEIHVVCKNMIWLHSKQASKYKLPKRGTP